MIPVKAGAGHSDIEAIWIGPSFQNHILCQLVSSLRIYVNWRRVILLLVVSPKFPCLRTQHFLFYQQHFHCLVFLCLFFAAPCHRLLRTLEIFLVPALFILPSRSWHFLHAISLPVNLARNEKKKRLTFRIPYHYDIFVPINTILPFNNYLYLFLILGSGSDSPCHQVDNMVAK